MIGPNTVPGFPYLGFAYPNLAPSPKRPVTVSPFLPALPQRPLIPPGIQPRLPQAALMPPIPAMPPTFMQNPVGALPVAYPTPCPFNAMSAQDGFYAQTIKQPSPLTEVPHTALPEHTLAPAKGGRLTEKAVQKSLPGLRKWMLLGLGVVALPALYVSLKTTLHALTQEFRAEFESDPGREERPTHGNPFSWATPLPSEEWRGQHTHQNSPSASISHRHRPPSSERVLAERTLPESVKKRLDDVRSLLRSQPNELTGVYVNRRTSGTEPSTEFSFVFEDSNNFPEPLNAEYGGDSGTINVYVPTRLVPRSVTEDKTRLAEWLKMPAFPAHANIHRPPGVFDIFAFEH